MTTPISSGVIFAFICLPAIYYIFLNFRFAAVLTLLLFIIICPIIWMKMTTYFTLLNFTLVYSAIWTISHMHELSRQKQNQQLEYQATHDRLSGLQNRLALDQAVQHLAKTGDAYYLFYIDIDHFKRINDQYSHTAGDSVLKQTAQILQHLTGSQQLYRIGGEEFLCLLPAQQCRDVLSLAEQIRSTFAESYYQYKNKQIQYTVSIGVSYSHTDTEFEVALHLADKALYRAKRGGRNQVCYDQSVQSKIM